MIILQVARRTKDHLKARFLFNVFITTRDEGSNGVFKVIFRILDDKVFKEVEVR